MHPEFLLWLILLVPAVSGLLCAVMPSAGLALGVMYAGVSASALFGALSIRTVFLHGPLIGADDWLCLDALSAYHLAVMLLVFCLSSAFAWIYFKEERRSDPMTPGQARLFSGLWCGTLSAMTLALVSNNIGMMWVGIEGTTLLTASLVCFHKSRPSLEATWKYVLICSVGLALAFLGTLLIVIAVRPLPLNPYQALLCTTLREHASLMDPALTRAGFLFLLVGYGTKAGLAPMHNWLPDAHSQAPAPVSALFSGFMLNASLYCLMRYLPVVEGATGGSGWCLRLLTGFGVLSIVLSAGFIVCQHDVKRLLAYSSVEHMGIIALGVGLGGLGVFAALFHTLNHSVGKTLAFFSAGRLGQRMGSHDMSRMTGALRVSPVWGLGILGSLLALIGVAPFAIFLSEFLIVKAAVDSGAFTVLFLFLLGAGVVFAGALRHLIPLVWGTSELSVEPIRTTGSELAIVLLPLLALLVLGLWMPDFLRNALNEASEVLLPPSLGGGGTP
jgi:hydrogenase-4 component F